MVSSNSKCQNLLITYIEDFKRFDPVSGKLVEHHDPTFEKEWSYCTGYKRLLSCKKENWVFFHATNKKYHERFITAYFKIVDVGLGKDIVPKYGIIGPASHAKNLDEHYVIVGDRQFSKKIREPGLKFDKTLAEKLEFNPPKKIPFTKGRSELQCIASATMNIRFLTDNDVDTLFQEIKLLK